MMIAHARQTREKLIEQSGVIAYRIRGGQVEVALVTASSGPHWTVPKGHVESHMTPEESAAKEAYEESGLIGEIGRRCVGRYFYEKRGALRRVGLYPLHVTKQLKRWPEMNRRQRQWMDMDEAMSRIQNTELRRCIQIVVEAAMRPNRRKRRALAA